MTHDSLGAAILSAKTWATIATGATYMVKLGQGDPMVEILVVPISVELASATNRSNVRLNRAIQSVQSAYAAMQAVDEGDAISRSSAWGAMDSAMREFETAISEQVRLMDETVSQISGLGPEFDQYAAHARQMVVKLTEVGERAREQFASAKATFGASIGVA